MKAMKRKMFLQMIREFQSGEAQVLLCAMSDRLSRNGGDAYLVQELIEDNGLIVAVAVDNILLQKPLNANEMLLFGVKNVISNYEVLLMKQRCNAGILARNLQGFRPTRTPYGYKNAKKQNTAVIIESRAKFVRKAFELCAETELTANEIANELYDQGYLYENESGIIPKQTLFSMLRNCFYTGEYVIKSTGEVQKGNHKAIIPKELFEKVQKKLGSFPKSPRKYDLLYSQMLKCDTCGRYMIGDVKKRGEKTYVYYACVNPQCSSKFRTTEMKIDDEVSSYLKEIRLPLIPDDIVKVVLNDELYPMKQKLSILNRNVHHRYDAERRLREEIAENNIVDEDFIRASYADIQAKYGDLKSKIYLAEKRIDMVKSKVAETLQKRLYDVFVNYDTKNKQKVLDLVTNSFKFGEKGLKMTFKSPFRKIRRRYASNV